MSADAQQDYQHRETTTRARTPPAHHRGACGRASARRTRTTASIPKRRARRLPQAVRMRPRWTDSFQAAGNRCQCGPSRSAPHSPGVFGKRAKSDHAFRTGFPDRRLRSAWFRRASVSQQETPDGKPPFDTLHFNSQNDSRPDRSPLAPQQSRSSALKRPRPAEHPCPPRPLTPPPNDLPPQSPNDSLHRNATPDLSVQSHTDNQGHFDTSLQSARIRPALPRTDIVIQSPLHGGS